MEFGSLMTISLQRVPMFPVPLFGLLLEEIQPSDLEFTWRWSINENGSRRSPDNNERTTPLITLMSIGHCYKGDFGYHENDHWHLQLEK